ncbi:MULTISPECIES: LysR family transcriptional regulator [unclassified Achromobacter]|uniref:LysR family transcriptional regulator n=1 Tax=unclassified Achromobacter TaxID=2626865 RepID=UPI000B519049|nr:MULTISPECIES: LysR family transcriptional regulator [unclassified Achromobacter]OWT80156.1 LysR family transcriptional regulator [Achromobacter sp. HZ34]OWT82039.1 LysR family transcriptional regulator [Achromobacter sp. HZ28]
MSYELKDLRLFKAIVQAGNLSAGAAAMHMTAPSASYRIKNLEYTAGSPLFVRSAKGMALTPAGEALARHADVLLANLQAMQEEVGAYARSLKGRIRVLANSSSLNGFIIPSLARFLASHIDVDLQEADSEAIAGAIRRGDADIGIFAGRAQDAELQCELYAIDRLICAAPTEHPLAARPRIGFAEALSHGFVCMDRASSNFHFLQTQAAKAGQSLNVRVHAHDFASVLYLVRAGVGLALVPTSVAEPDLRAGTMAGIALVDAWALRDLHLVTRQDASNAGLVRQFADMLLHDPLVTATRSREPGAPWMTGASQA